MMALAPQVGKAEAHRLAEAASRRASVSGQHLREVLLADADVTAHLNPRQIEGLFDPLQYTGAASRFMDRVLAEAQGRLKTAGE